MQPIFEWIDSLSTLGFLALLCLIYLVAVSALYALTIRSPGWNQHRSPEPMQKEHQ